MEFCDDCGKILIIQKVGICSCGFSKEVKDLVITEKIHKIREKEKADGIIDNKNENIRLEDFPHDCKKCNNNSASVVEFKTGYSDEANIYLFKCTKCGYTERQADGSSNM